MSESTSTPGLIVTVGPIAHGGHCVARHEGRVIFVRHAIPGEIVEIALTEHDADAKFWRADVTRVLEASADRVQHFWPEADALRAASRQSIPVGGAEFGHVSRPRQRALKTAVVREQLQRLGGLSAEILDELFSDGVQDVDSSGTLEQANGLGWRTRVGFAVTPSGKVGMHSHRSHTIIPIEEMPLALPAVNDLRLWEHDFTGIERVEVAAPANGSGVLVLVAPAAGLSEKAAGAAVKRVARSLAGCQTPPSVARWNFESGAIEVQSGRGWVRETTADHEFRVTGDGFWQIHRNAPKILTDAALGALLEGGYLNDGAHVADLYAGAGLFSAPLADAVGPQGSVLSVEAAPGTSRDARKNLHSAAQVEIVQSRVEQVMGGERRGLSAVVLDPPRAGAGKSVVRSLVAQRPSAIVYVSCDPASLARDVKYFANAGWQVDRITAFDLYPHTHHVETVVRLTKVTPSKKTDLGRS
ncbi:class I SAM-dependent RNA methyltransferase [Arthrobacter cryoconiti]|uniref:Class I SAM-dependent RNA methyltransferase n=1 Tax=Arthrobacter cryoconiti TaxID=748907 RepID=A0ABV8R1W2_9MICC|nr:TRAM domain-containing protein [Arthrobacter cryoconiti]MCC9069042.1 class I SAM-dependent RNA methyltransferase [Arthrobacter cryoconiti]